MAMIIAPLTISPLVLSISVVSGNVGSIRTLGPVADVAHKFSLYKSNAVNVTHAM